MRRKPRRLHHWSAALGSADNKNGRMLSGFAGEEEKAVQLSRELYRTNSRTDPKLIELRSRQFLAVPDNSKADGLLTEIRGEAIDVYALAGRSHGPDQAHSRDLFI